jgi:hypothetical protein
MSMRSAVLPAITVKLCRSPDSQSSTRNATARATATPFASPATLRLADACEVNNTASSTINGNDTNNIAATNR